MSVGTVQSSCVADDVYSLPQLIGGMFGEGVRFRVLRIVLNPYRLVTL